MLAELKLHIRDEYKQNDTAKARLKRHIAGTPRTSVTSQSQPGTESLVSTAATPHADADPSTSLPLQQQSGSGSGPETPQADDTAFVSSAGPAEGSLDDIVQRLLSFVNAEDNVELHPSPAAASRPSPIKLSDLFNFTAGYWSKTAESIGARGLQDELEFYELLDMDASGELDTDVADGMSEAILMSN
jgi:hypothetical protein